MAKMINDRQAAAQSKDFKALLHEELRAGLLRSVYVLEGADQHRIGEVAVFLRKKAVTPGSEAFSDHIVDVETAGWAGVLQQARSIPMFGGTQVVWARHAETVNKQAKDPSETALAEYLKEPVDSTLLIISGEHFDARRSWMKIAKEKGYHVLFPAPSGAELHAWIKKTAAKSGLTLDTDAVRLLAELIGSNLGSLLAEIQKLALLEKAQAKPLGRSLLPDLVLEQAELDAFSLTDAIDPGSGPQILKNWYGHAFRGRALDELLPLLLTHLRRAVMVSASLGEGESEAELLSETGLNAWMLRHKLKPLARKLNAARRHLLLRACLDCETAVKRRPLPSDVAFEQLLATIGTLESLDHRSSGNIERM